MENKEQFTKQELQCRVHSAFSNRRLEEVTRLVREYGGPLLNGNTRGVFHEYTLLEAACRFHRPELVELLLELKETDVFPIAKDGALPWADLFSLYGDTPAHEAVRIRIIGLFAKKDLEYLNQKGRNILNTCIDVDVSQNFILRCMQFGAWDCWSTPQCYHMPDRWKERREMYCLVRDRKLVLSIMQVGARKPIKMPREIWRRVTQMLFM